MNKLESSFKKFFEAINYFFGFQEPLWPQVVIAGHWCIKFCCDLSLSGSTSKTPLEAFQLLMHSIPNHQPKPTILLSIHFKLAHG